MPGDALSNMRLAITYEWNLTCKFWFGFKAFQSLPPQLQAFMLVCDGISSGDGKAWIVRYMYEMDNVPQQLPGSRLR